MMRFAIGPLALLLFCNSALAQVQVPMGCFELAAREGFPTDSLTKTQAARARIRMAQLSNQDPLVLQCRSAIRQAQAMLEIQKKRSAEEARRQSENSSRLRDYATNP